MYDSKADYKLFRSIDCGNSIQIDVQIVKVHLGHVVLITGNYTNNSTIDVHVNSQRQEFSFNQNTMDQMMVRGFMLHGDEHDKPMRVIVKHDNVVKMDETICL